MVGVEGSKGLGHSILLAVLAPRLRAVHASHVIVHVAVETTGHANGDHGDRVFRGMLQGKGESLGAVLR